MSGEAVPLSVIPAALQGASGAISGQALPRTLFGMIAQC